MHREDTYSKYLLFIEPNASEKLSEPIEDELVELIEMALNESTPGTSAYSDLDDLGTFYGGEGKFKGSGYKGIHITDCGKTSSNKDYLLKNGMITNSLAPFYLRWYRNSIPETELKKLEVLKEFYEIEGKKISKFGKLIDTTQLDMSNFWENKKKREAKEMEKYNKELKKESDRVEKMKCPCCKSTDKTLFRQTENNGIFGPGFYSHVISEYYICQNCGVHYTDLKKKEIKPPSITNRLF